MSANEDVFAPPPFKPDEALQRLKRELRELGLAEREGVFERRGLAIARVRIDGDAAGRGHRQAAQSRQPAVAGTRTGQQCCAARLRGRTEEGVADMGRPG